MRLTGRKTRVAAVLCALSLGSSSIAEPMVSDNNCEKAEFSELQQFQSELCQAHLGCRMTAVLAEKGCSAVRFFRNIGDIFTRKTEIDNNDVMDAYEPEYPQTPGTQRIVSKAREASKQAGTKGYRFEDRPVRTKAGSYASYDGGWDLEAKKAEGGGTMIWPNGDMQRGYYVDGKPSGPGQTIYGGMVEGGEYREGLLQGAGFRASPANGQMETIEGTFDKDVPVGEIVRTYSDGSSVREIWEGGKMVVRGERAPKGVVPPVVLTPKQLAEKSAAEEFNSKISNAANAGELYALADELWEKSDVAGARKVLRALLSKYPDSPLAAVAAQRLNGTGGNTAPPPVNAGNVTVPAANGAQTQGGSAGYRTQIENRILPNSFHARFTGKGLPRATCEAQEGANISYVDIPANGTRALYRKAAAAMELGMAIFKQCEDDPAVWKQIVEWKNGRDQALKNCEAFSTTPSTCYDLYRD